MAVTMKNAVFWDVTPHRSCVVSSPATCSLWFLTHRFFYPEDGGNTFLRNVGSHKIYMAPHLRRQHSVIFSLFAANHCIDMANIPVSCLRGLLFESKHGDQQSCHVMSFIVFLSLYFKCWYNTLKNRQNFT
jgi:hypothetical protein